jgi:rhodanese-related sulfurtransferase/CBS domain-containing protein
MTEAIPKEIDREGIRLLMRRGGQLVEVLPREEYNRIHLVGAVSIPLSHFGRTLADRLKWDKPVIVYGRDSLDDLSARAAWRLSTLGFTQIYRYTAGKADWLANGLMAEGAEARASGAGDLADLDVPTCRRGERLSEVRQRVQKDGWNTCVVVNEGDIVLGLLRASAFEQANPQWPAEEAMESAPQTYRLNSPVEEVRAYFDANRVVDSVLVTTTEGKLFGLIARFAPGVFVEEVS